MENCFVVDPGRQRRPHGISGSGDFAGLLSESFTAVVSEASARSPESMSSIPPPRRDPPGGRAARKRKSSSRSCKRSPTTYIAASPAHFRELVQRVTGNRSAEEMNPPLQQAASRAPPAYDPAGLFGSDPALAEFDPLLWAASRFPASYARDDEALGCPPPFDGDRTDLETGSSWRRAAYF